MRKNRRRRQKAIDRAALTEGRILGPCRDPNQKQQYLNEEE